MGECHSSCLTYLVHLLQSSCLMSHPPHIGMLERRRNLFAAHAKQLAHPQSMVLLPAAHSAHNKSKDNLPLGPACCRMRVRCEQVCDGRVGGEVSVGTHLPLFLLKCLPEARHRKVCFSQAECILRKQCMDCLDKKNDVPPRSSARSRTRPHH